MSLFLLWQLTGIKAQFQLLPMECPLESNSFPMVFCPGVLGQDNLDIPVTLTNLQVAIQNGPAGCVIINSPGTYEIEMTDGVSIDSQSYTFVEPTLNIVQSLRFVCPGDDICIDVGCFAAENIEVITPLASSPYSYLDEFRLCFENLGPGPYHLLLSNGCTQNIINVADHALCCDFTEDDFEILVDIGYGQSLGLIKPEILWNSSITSGFFIANVKIYSTSSVGQCEIVYEENSTTGQDFPTYLGIEGQSLEVCATLINILGCQSYKCKSVVIPTGRYEAASQKTLNTNAPSLFPNPTSELLHFIPNSSFDTESSFFVKIFTADGKIIKSLPSLYLGSENMGTIPINEFTNGFYVLQIAQGDNSMNLKFIINK